MQGAIRLLVFLPVLCPSPGAAQGATVTIPKIFRDTFGSAPHLSPFGRTKFFGQTWYRGDSMPAAMVISQIGWRAPLGRTASATTLQMEIVLDNSRSTTLSKTFTANLGPTPTTFFRSKPLRLPAITGGGTDPGRPISWIPGDQPMVYIGPHLLVQTDVQSPTPPQTNGYLVDGFSASVGTFASGKSCGASVLEGNVSGGQYTLRVRGAPPGATVLFHIGLDNRTSGGVGLPLDLSVIGMTGCELRLDPLLALSRTADSTGTAQLPVPTVMPQDAFMSFVQGSHAQQGANPVNYVTTNVVSAIWGTSGLGNYVYNWVRFGPTAEYGPYPTHFGQVMLLR